jgi:hypothetical protein
MRTGRAWLCAGPVLLCLLDGGLTLQGQSEAYWAGHYEQANEANPLGRWPLEGHPLCFVAVLACWILIFCTSICRLPGKLARLAALVVQLGHTFGAATWLLRADAFGWLAGLLVLSVSWLVLSWWWISPPLAVPVASGED